MTGIISVASAPNRPTILVFRRASRRFVKTDLNLSNVQGKPRESMSKLYILGGRQRKPGLKEATYQNEWYLYEAGLILEVDTDTGAAKTCVEYRTPREVRAGEHEAAHFHSGAIAGNKLYTCTSTEVLIYRIPDFQQIGYLSLPCFNDVHHVTPSSDGNLLVVSTGLDMIVKITPQGEILKEWSAFEEAPWTRFSRNVDYRRVVTTRPHVSHPNFVFELDGELWVTRFYQRDAISLNGSRRHIDIATEAPHDGFMLGDRICFTTVDCKIVLVNRKSLRIEDRINLREIQDRDGEVLPAWCRGLCPLDDRRFWVGFTRIRSTRLRENVRWVKTVLNEGTRIKPTHIALFDIAEKNCLKEIDLEPYGMNAIYGIFPAPNQESKSA